MRRQIRPEESVTEVIVRAVADTTGRDPVELEPFAESIDPDAIESLFKRSSTDGPESLTLLYEGCRVTVDQDAVTVERIPDA